MSFSITANNIKTTYTMTIEEGTYTNQQMATELTNKMNSAVSDSYSGFTVAYNEIDSKLYFGNNADNFQIEGLADPMASKNIFPSYSNSGLLSYLGFNGRSVNSNSSVEAPRFFYSNVNGGNWLPFVPPPATYYTLIPPNKTNLSGNPYFFIELNGFNCIDEMIPYTNSEYTRENNVTNGTLNAAFAKLPKNILQYVKANYKGQKIKEAAIITNNKGLVKYETEIKGFDLIFDAAGEFMKAEKD
jgi:hypothetical protein